MLEAEKEQKSPENETEEGWSSSRTLSPVFPVPLSPGPGADEQSSTDCPVGVEEVGKCSLVNKSGVSSDFLFVKGWKEPAANGQVNRLVRDEHRLARKVDEIRR